MIKVKNNLSLRVFLLLNILGISTLVMQAQDKFHRLYQPQNEKNVLSLKSIQAKNGSYFALHIELEESGIKGEFVFGDTLIITNFHPKGDVSWSKFIALSGNYKKFKPQLASIIQGQNDSIYYSVVALDDKLPVNITGSLNLNGNLGFVRANGTSSTKSDNSGEANLLLNYNKALFNSYSAVVATEQSIHLSKKRYNGNISWVKSLGATVDNKNIKESLLGFEFANDTTFVLTGLIDSLTPKPFIAVLDTLGNPILSKSYKDISVATSTPINAQASKLSDETFVLTGTAIERNITSRATAKGYIIKTNKIGNIVWSKKVGINPNDSTVVKHCLVDKDNNIVIAGAIFSLLEKKKYPFLAKLDQAGKVLWQKKFDKTDSSFDFTGSLFQSKDQGYVYYTTANKDGFKVPSFIKTNKEGLTSCESDLVGNLLVDNVFRADTLIWKTTNITNVTENIIAKTAAHNFEIPVLSLAVRPFCPNEPIDWTFDAYIKSATSYLWSDKSTADTLRVFKEGEYSVMVTINEDVCYTLCDTAKLERYSKPQAQINLSLGNFCANGKQTLSLGYQPGHPQIKTVNWSTGVSAAESIEITTPGTYSVTVVDQCNETATAMINVGPFPKKITMATLTGTPSVNCTRGTISGILTAGGDAVGLGELRYRWSTGATTAAITISDSEVLTYTVTVTDGCGNSLTASKVFELKGASNNNFQITKTINGLCKNKTITLNIIATEFSSTLKYIWSTSQATPNINVDKAGTYAATMTDVCNNTFTKDIKIEPSEFEVKELVYAKIFFPDGTLGPAEVDTSDAYKSAEKFNRTFGPVNLPEYCLNDVTDYELHVFNRWGQEVFVTDDIREEWNGTYQDKPAPTESYLWAAKYKIFGIEKTLKGSVTMIRR